MQEIIQTPVDDLVNLIFARGKISALLAASELKLPISQIEDWANSLEKHNVISIEYKMDGMYLVASSMTEEDFAKKVSSFITRKKAIEKTINDIERSSCVNTTEQDELKRKLVDLDKKADKTARDHLFLFNMFNFRRKSKEAQALEEQNFQNALQVDKEADIMLRDMKNLEKCCNTVGHELSHLKSEMFFLDNQNSDIEKIDMKNFALVLEKLEKKIKALETKRFNYTKTIESIKDKISKMTEKVGAENA